MKGYCILYIYIQYIHIIHMYIIYIYLKCCIFCGSYADQISDFQSSLWSDSPVSSAMITPMGGESRGGLRTCTKKYVSLSF